MTLEDVQSEKLALKRSSDTLPVDSPKAIKRRRTAPVDLQPSSLSTDKARIVPDGTALQPVSQNAHTESLSSAASKSTSQTASGAKGTASLDAKNGVESDDDYSDLSSVVASDSESDEVGRPLRKVQKVNGHTPMFEAQKLRTPSPEIQEPNHGQDHGPCETNLVPPVIPTLARDKPSARKRTIREPPAGRKRKVTTESPRVGQEARERRCSNRLDHTEKGSLQAQNTPVKPFDAAGTRRTPRRVGRRKNIDVQGSNPQVPENDTFSPDVTESEERTRPTSNGNDTGTSLGLGEESAATTTSVNEENSEMQGTQASPLLDGDSVVSSVLELSKTLDEEELGGAERKRTHDTEVAVSPSAKAQSSVSVMKPDVDEHSSYRPSSDHSDVDSSTRSSRRAHLRRSKAKNIIRIPAVDTPLSKKLRKLDISDASVLEQARGNPVQTNAESTSAVGKGGAELVAVGRSQRQVQVICRSSMHMENVRVQSSRCKTRSYARYPACSACVGAQAGATCRFLDFRAFLCGNQPKDHAVFLSDDAADDLGLDKLASLQHFPTLSKDLEYKLFLSYDAFIASAEKELAHIPADDQDKRGRDDGMPLHCIKRPLPNVRQSCDACEQGIYNVHYYCVKCGRDYCITCFEEHWMAASDSLDDGRNREQSSTEPKTRSIHYCRKSKTEGIKFHGYRDMLVISRWSKKQMQDALGWVKRWMDIHRERVRDRIQHDEECAAGMANQASDQPLTSERNDADGQERSEETSLISSPCEILEEHLEVGRKPTENTPHEHGNSNKLSVPTITDGQLLHNHPETMLTDEPESGGSKSC
ncbi:hypothetical protein BC832DRAFT_486569 [Gaertneriomyces semiglobifer]|nr:hypothetical protein BC832DRAFT_486569 [Gaertneriomyces semiglobifer]